MIMIQSQLRPQWSLVVTGFNQLQSGCCNNNLLVVASRLQNGRHQLTCKHSLTTCQTTLKLEFFKKRTFTFRVKVVPYTWNHWAYGWICLTWYPVGSTVRSAAVCTWKQRKSLDNTTECSMPHHLHIMVILVYVITAEHFVDLCTFRCQIYPSLLVSSSLLQVLILSVFLIFHDCWHSYLVI